MDPRRCCVEQTGEVGWRVGGFVVFKWLFGLIDNRGSLASNAASILALQSAQLHHKKTNAVGGESSVRSCQGQGYC